MAFTEFKGSRLYYEELGEGDPVLVIHGAAASGLWFGDLPARLARTHRVIMPDLRGLGRSERVEVLAGPKTWVEDMWHIMDVTGLASAHIMGCSLGSRIAARMAIENPARVRTLTVDAPIIGLSTHGNTSLSTVFGQVDEDSDQAREWAHLHGPDWRDVVAFYGRARGTPGLQEYLTVRDELEQISMPTLICRGDLDDPIHPLEASFIWHKQTPRTELFVAPGMTQSSVMLERKDDFLTAFAAFLARNDKGVPQ